MDYIETLPLTAGPAIFGMHENANISCAFTEAMGMFDTLLTMEASGGSSVAVAARRSSSRTKWHRSQKNCRNEGRGDVPGIQMQYPVTCTRSR